MLKRDVATRLEGANKLKKLIEEQKEKEAKRNEALEKVSTSLT